MKKLIGLAALCFGVIVVNDSRAQTPVLWNMTVSGVLGKYDYPVARDGRSIPFTGLEECKQLPVRLFRDTNGDLQEEVRITCSVGIGSKVSLIQTCFEGKPDQSWGAMKVEDTISNYTIALSCLHR